MRAIILAAGRGVRMKNLTEKYPKCLLKLNGKTLLDWQLGALADAKIEEVAIVTGYKNETLFNKCRKEFHNSNWARSNMVSSLACAAEWLKAEPCIVSYSDIFYKTSAVQSLIKNESKLAITYDPSWIGLWTQRFGDPLIDAETFRLDECNNLVEIGNVPKSVEEVQGQYMGLLRFTPASWKEVERIRRGLSPLKLNKIDMTGLLQKVIESNNINVKAIPYLEEWGEVDTQEDLSVYKNRKNL